MALSTGTDDKIAKAYDSPSWWYDVRGFFIFHLSYNDTLPSLIRFFARNLEAPHLEGAVGSGSFFELVLLWKRFVRREGKSSGEAFDYSPRMLEGAVARFGEVSPWKLRIADAGAMPYPDGAFRSANVANAFHCFPEPEKALREFHRVLAEGGTLAMNVLTPAGGWAPLRWVADRVAEWGMRKGILFAPIEEAKMLSMASEVGFEVLERRRRGNNLSLLLRKGASG